MELNPPVTFDALARDPGLRLGGAAIDPQSVVYGKRVDPGGLLSTK